MGRSILLRKRSGSTIPVEKLNASNDDKAACLRSGLGAVVLLPLPASARVS
jgi:hypothetical protein